MCGLLCVLCVSVCLGGWLWLCGLCDGLLWCCWLVGCEWGVFVGVWLCVCVFGGVGCLCVGVCCVEGVCLYVVRC